MIRNKLLHILKKHKQTNLHQDNVIKSDNEIVLSDTTDDNK